MLNPQFKSAQSIDVFVGPVARWPDGSAASRVVFLMLLWTAVGWIFSLPELNSGHYGYSLRICLTEFWTWGFIAPLVFAFDRRLPFPEKQLGRRVAAHLTASAVFTVIYLYIFTATEAVLAVTPLSSLRASQLFTLTNLGWHLQSWLICCVIVGAVLSCRYYERYISAELHLEEARLNLLRVQLDPHFVFNTLNTICSHAERDPKLTRRMIEHLGDMLRLSLESKDKQKVSLAEEMDFLEHYLAIQKIRFGAQLRVEMEIAPGVRFASVPPLILQPLVENAIRHGISRRSDGGKVVVKAASVDGRLEIRVLDDGVGLPMGWSMERSAGLGLSITSERILGYYPKGDWTFTVRNRVEAGTVVEISLPLNVNGTETEETSSRDGAGRKSPSSRGR
jgi:two-component system, LytTR family, sensor kinase